MRGPVSKRWIMGKLPWLRVWEPRARQRRRIQRRPAAGAQENVARETAAAHAGWAIRVIPGTAGGHTLATAGSGRWVMYAMALAAALAASQPATPPAVPPAEQAPPAVAVQQPPHIPDLAEIMAIPPELRVLLQERGIAPGGTRQEQLERLGVLVSDQTALAIEYDNDRTRTVAETGRDRRANCVSYTLLFVALARAAGMDAYVQEAGEVLAWYRDAGVIYSASHVNAGIRSGMRQQTVDVDRNILATRGRPRGVSDARALAHFYNNRGAELMAD